MHRIICYSYLAIDRERNDYNNSLPKACINKLRCHCTQTSGQSSRKVYKWVITQNKSVVGWDKVRNPRRILTEGPSTATLLKNVPILVSAPHGNALWTNHRSSRGDIHLKYKIQQNTHCKAKFGIVHYRERARQGVRFKKLAYLLSVRTKSQQTQSFYYLSYKILKIANSDKWPTTNNSVERAQSNLLTTAN